MLKQADKINNNSSKILVNLNALFFNQTALPTSMLMVISDCSLSEQVWKLNSTGFFGQG